MKQHWHVDPLPPPEGDGDHLDGFISNALIIFVSIGSLIYFDQELHTIENWTLELCWTLESWLSPVLDLFEIGES